MYHASFAKEACKNVKLKVYLNGKLLRKKIIIKDNRWGFVRPLKLTKDDVLTYTWNIS